VERFALGGEILPATRIFRPELGRVVSRSTRRSPRTLKKSRSFPHRHLLEKEAWCEESSDAGGSETPRKSVIVGSSAGCASTAACRSNRRSCGSDLFDVTTAASRFAAGRPSPAPRRPEVKAESLRLASAGCLARAQRASRRSCATRRPIAGRGRLTRPKNPHG
jgi:hypothetical protein